ncbi:BPL-N domain-containing protein [Actinoallomurus sp. NPDC052274]|uniref:BPL-N domain-containing protein n=1 Tax=Actinoallomurus sp. NPDC052274 TaxID=3155420 RepID=UPI00343498B8
MLVTAFAPVACAVDPARRRGPSTPAGRADRRAAPAYGANPAERPVALVYRGPAAIPGCPEAVAALIRDSAWNFDVRYAGPNEQTKLTAAALSGAGLYAQPGGGELDDGYRHMRPYASDIRAYVAAGGRYLGFCLGGYLAGATPGFGLLPGDAGQFIATPGASVRTDRDTLVEVRWRDRRIRLYFQDGPYFWTGGKASGVTVLATYTNGRIAAMVAPYGRGRVGVVGPHPEATADWYEEHRLVNPGGVDPAPGRDLIDTLMRA